MALPQSLRLKPTPLLIQFGSDLVPFLHVVGSGEIKHQYNEIGVFLTSIADHFLFRMQDNLLSFLIPTQDGENICQVVDGLKIGRIGLIQTYY